MRKQFRDTVLDIGTSDARIVMVFGDVSVYLFKDFQALYPSRFYNVGICENTLVSLGAGLSSQGFVPFIHTINPFITERSFEQIKLDLCYNGFGANILSCGASFDYAWDGATHHAYTDMAILRLLPETEIIQPGSRHELDVLLRSQYNNGKVTYFRLSDHPHEVDMPVKFGEAVVLKEGHPKVTVVTAGPILANVLEACRDLDVNIVYFHTIKPIDHAAISRFRHTKIVVVHDAFGLFEAVCEVPDISASYYGLPDKFCSWYGTLHDIRKKIGLDAFAIREHVCRKIQES
jgi:transketolase